ncbi:MAG: hypothetical protein ABIC57_02415 [bacterium]
MPIKDTLKKHFLFDGIIIGVIIVFVIVAFWITSSGPIGWEIEKETVTVEDQEKTVEENIYVHNKGHLKLLSSTLEFISDMEMSVWLEGQAEMTILDSVIKTSDTIYTFSLYEKDGKSPSMTVESSDLLDHYGIFLNDDSKFEANTSVIGKLVMMGDSYAKVKNSELSLVLDSERKEEYSGLSNGPSKNFSLASREGWEIEVENSEISDFQVNIDEDDEVLLSDFSGVKVLFSISRGDHENFLTLPPLLISNSGKLDGLDFDLSWQDTIFLGFSFILDDSNIKIEKTSIGDLLLTNSDIEVRQSDIACTYCSLFDSSSTLNTVVFAPKTEMNVYGDSTLEISNSDITDITIFLNGNSDLILKNCQYDENNIENNGDGEIRIV